MAIKDQEDVDRHRELKEEKQQTQEVFVEISPPKRRKRRGIAKVIKEQLGAQSAFEVQLAQGFIVKLEESTFTLDFFLL